MKKPGRESFSTSRFGIFIYFLFPLISLREKKKHGAVQQLHGCGVITLQPERAKPGTSLPSAALDPPPGLQGVSAGRHKPVLFHTGTFHEILAFKYVADSSHLRFT